ncbi:Scr1 family TA system antitoxin-like transcriptional regulator [Streptomyces sp. NPDC050504]|uniref:helix-turn-helix domain-containing protein n=1 Tax=Streptomyces sp. NPDC050504 TaxID=3365618 RepID=UPI0037BC4AF2
MPRLKEPDPGENLEQYIGSLIQDARLKRRADARNKGQEEETWTQEFLAERALTSQTRISGVETGDDPPDLSLASDLERVLGLQHGTIRNLVKILNQEGVKDYAKTFVSRLPMARMISAFGPIVPGLLQTPEYAGVLVLAGQAGDSRDVQRYVEGRMDRSRRVWAQPEPPWMTAIVSEAVLRSDMGNPGAVRGQLEQLLERPQQEPNIKVRVLPLSAASVAGSLTLLTFPDNSRSAYMEGYSTGSYVEEIAQVMRYQRVYDRLAEDALSARQSADLIREALKRFE